MTTDGRNRGVLLEVMEDIQTIFDNAQEKATPDKPIYFVDASEFMLTLPYSKKTINQAKELMGVRSQRIGRRWVWRMPKKDVGKASMTWEKKREKPKRVWDKVDPLDRVSVHYLAIMMKEHNYEGKASLLLKEYPRSRISANVSRKILGVISIKRKDGWWWVWPDTPVTDWLRKKLLNGIVLVDKIMQAAAHEHGWSPELIKEAREKIGAWYLTRDDKLYMVNSAGTGATDKEAWRHEEMIGILSSDYPIHVKEEDASVETEQREQ